MKYAIIRLQGHQYKVSEGEEILVDKLTGKAEAEVLLLVADKKISVGKPVLKDAKVNLKVVGEAEKGKKIEIMKFRAKSRYRRKMGFRPIFSRILVEKIA
jgi:large subunit ribosomal protein L21